MAHAKQHFVCLCARGIYNEKKAFCECIRLQHADGNTAPWRLLKATTVSADRSGSSSIAVGKEFKKLICVDVKITERSELIVYAIGNLFCSDFALAYFRPSSSGVMF